MLAGFIARLVAGFTARLEAGFMARLVAGFMAMLNPVSVSGVLGWVRGVLLKLAALRLLVVDTFSMSIPLVAESISALMPRVVWLLLRVGMGPGAVDG